MLTSISFVLRVRNPWKQNMMMKVDSLVMLILIVLCVRRMETTCMYCNTVYSL